MARLEHRLGFIGAGRMATALARGFIAADLIDPQRVIASDPSAAARENFQRETLAGVTDDNLRVVAESRMVWLAVKPQYMPEALAVARQAVTAEHLVVSIAAGVTLAALREGLGAAPRLVRVMPNTPSLIGRGASVYCLGPGASEEDERAVGALLASVGTSASAPEKLLDAVTGLSGSGPAFVYLMIEALSDGGVLMGLPRELATALAAQTVAGAAHMVLETGEHTGALKDQVTSPGGTTIAGLRALEEHGVRAGFINAVRCATERSIELGKPS